MVDFAGPDLSAGQRAMERLMDDGCVIGVLKSPGLVFDPETGTVTDPENPTLEDLDVIYSKDTLGTDGRSLADPQELGGMCVISVVGRAARPDLVNVPGGGSVEEQVGWYRGNIPLNAPEIPDKGAFLLVTAARRDPQLVGDWFRVREVIDESLIVARSLLLEKR